MQASHKRAISSGREYERYFDLSRLKRSDKVLLNRSSVFDTVAAMAKIVKKTLPDTRQIAKRLEAATLQQTCKNIFDFVYSHVQYTLDKEGVEQLRRPLRTWADRAEGVDCDCYSIFISSILSNLRIEHYLRMTSYQGDWQHIYVVVPTTPGKAPSTRMSYYAIDCVVDRFDYEVPFTKNHDTHMSALQYLDGLPTARKTDIPGFGAEAVGFGTGGSISGLGAAGTAEGLYADMLDRMKLHLTNTLVLLKSSPNMLPAAAGRRFRSQVEQLLAVWDNAPERTRLLDLFAAYSDDIAISGLGALSGWPKSMFDNIGKGIKQAAGWVGDKVSDGAKAVATGVKNAAEWTGDKAKKAVEAVKDAGQYALDKMIQLNPVSVLMRNGLLLAFKLNLFRMAERLGYGYWTEAEAVSKGLDVSEYRKLKGKLADVQKMWKGLRGDEDSLKKNILQGWEHGVKKRGGVSGLGEPVSAVTGTAAASGLIATILGWLKGIDFSKLFQFVKNALDRPASTNYDASNTIPKDFILPNSEEEYLADQGRYEPTGTPPGPTPKKDNTMLIVGGLMAAGLVLMSSQK